MRPTRAILISAAALILLAGCSILDPAWTQTMEGIRALPPDAPTPGFAETTGSFITAVLTILGGTLGGSALYGGVIRPRRIARENGKPNLKDQVRDAVIEQVRKTLEKKGFTDGS
jgi:hypothetical protein